jgi:hypothetical protein
MAVIIFYFTASTKWREETADLKRYNYVCPDPQSQIRGALSRPITATKETRKQN